MRVQSLLAGLLALREAAGFAPSLPSPSLSHSSARARSAAVAPPPSSLAPLLRGAGFGTTQLFMGWGPDPVWSEGTVESNFQACPSGSCVSLKIAVGDGTKFVNPGQYVQVKVAGDADAKPAILAIASAPSGEPPKPAVKGKKGKAAEADAAAGPEPVAPVPATWEFLVKKTDNNSWLTDVAKGAEIDVSQVMGGGFPIADEIDGLKYDFPAQNVLLFAQGSGISPIRSAIESGRLGTAPEGSDGKGARTCTLYYGVRTPDDMPYASKFAEWEERGVQVVPVVSRPDEAGEGDAKWGGRTGYIQNALEEDGVAIPRNSGALMCGVKGMCESVRSLLTQSGVFEGRVLTNF